VSQNIKHISLINETLKMHNIELSNEQLKDIWEGIIIQIDDWIDDPNDFKQQTYVDTMQIIIVDNVSMPLLVDMSVTDGYYRYNEAIEDNMTIKYICVFMTKDTKGPSWEERF